MKNRLLFLSLAAVFAATSSNAAHATEVNDVLTSFSLTSPSAGVFDFSFTGAYDSGSGVMDATETATAGEWLITSITGVTDGSAITALLDVDTYPAPLATNDNLVYYPPAVTSSDTDPAFLDINGVSYTLADGGDINLYYGVYTGSDPEAYNLISGAPPIPLDALPDPPATPEPASLLLLGTGLLGIGGITMRRRHAVVA